MSANNEKTAFRSLSLSLSLSLSQREHPLVEIKSLLLWPYVYATIVSWQRGTDALGWRGTVVHLLEHNSTWSAWCVGRANSHDDEYVSFYKHGGCHLAAVHSPFVLVLTKKHRCVSTKARARARERNQTRVTRVSRPLGRRRKRESIKRARLEIRVAFYLLAMS